MRPSLLLSLSLLVACAGRTDLAPADDASVTDTTDLDAPADVSEAGDTTPPPDAADATRCATLGSCVVVPRSCCGSCGAATPSDMIGVELSRLSTYRGAVCTGMGCPACYREQDAFLQAFCEGGSCVAHDLRTEKLTACATDADCVLRYAACCEPCDAPLRGLLALRHEQVSAYLSRACAPDRTCPKCAVRYPPAAKASCDKTYHCTVTGIGSL